MSLRRVCTTIVGAALAAASIAVTAPAASAGSADGGLGTASLAELLASDGNRFDLNPGDYDILDQAVLAVLTAKPDSPVGILADGTQALTAFIPNDGAFRRFVRDVLGEVPVTEPDVLGALVNGVGIDTVEAVLLYHVVPGVTIDSSAALASDGAVLTSAAGGTFTVDVVSVQNATIRLIDQDPNDRNPFLLKGQLDLNIGNLQIAHGIPVLLRPSDL